MDLETLNTYIATLVTVAYGRAEEPGELSSGGEEYIWCESESKAMELFGMEFSTFVRAHPGDLLWGEQPHILNRKWFSKSPNGFFKEVKLYCVSASFEIVSPKVSVKVSDEAEPNPLACRHCGEKFSREAARETHEQEYCSKVAKQVTADAQG